MFLFSCDLCLCFLCVGAICQIFGQVSTNFSNFFELFRFSRVMRRYWPRYSPNSQSKASLFSQSMHFSGLRVCACENTASFVPDFETQNDVELMEKRVNWVGSPVGFCHGLSRTITGPNS